MATETKVTHTLGPWTEPRHYRDSKGTLMEIAIYGGPHARTICAISPRANVSAEEQEANAQLIAAAPQLLEALERVTELAGDAYANDAESARVLLDASADIARAAIRAARGEAAS